MDRLILHIDMNAYFASVAEAINPSLKGKPIAIGVDNNRSVVSTANYKARSYGIHSAMPIYQAKKLCKDLIIVDHDFKTYEKYTYMFIQIIKRYSKKIEMFSIDECFVDMSEYLNKDNDIELIVKKIQYEILNELALPCSIGVSYGKYLAKIASDIKKPLGITYITRRNYKDKIWPLEIGSMFGIGKKSAQRLIECGIKTIGDLANCYDDNKLKACLGNGYASFRDIANGIDNSTLNLEFEPMKSLGHSRTFEHDTNDIDEIHNMIKKLAEMVSKRAIDHYVVGNNVCITVKFSDFKLSTKTIKLHDYTNTYETISKVALELYDNYYFDKTIRLIGVTLQNTIKINDYQKQLSIFEDTNKDISLDISETRRLINELNKQAGKELFKTAREIK